MTEPHAHAVREWMATETEYAKLYVERDLLLWLHAEAVWQREQFRIEADHQWTVRRQMGHRVIDTDTELTGAVDLARWLLAEAAWQQEVCRHDIRERGEQR